MRKAPPYLPYHTGERGGQSDTLDLKISQNGVTLGMIQGCMVGFGAGPRSRRVVERIGEAYVDSLECKAGCFLSVLRISGERSAGEVHYGEWDELA